jgi:hypothetical protein
MITRYWLAFALGVLWRLWGGQASQRRLRPGRVFPGTLSPPKLSVQW